MIRLVHHSIAAMRYQTKNVDTVLQYSLQVIFNKRDIESSRLDANQFAYRNGGGCTNALIKM